MNLPFSKDKIYLSVTRGMKVSSSDVSVYGLGVEIQDFALLSGMRAERDANQKYWRDFTDVYKSKRTFHAPFVDMHLGSPREDERKYASDTLLESFGIAKELDARIINIHSGWPPESAAKYDVKADWSLIGETIQHLGEEAQKMGLEIVVENVFESEPEMLLALISDIDLPNIGLCFDTGHAFVKGGAPPEEWVRSYGGHLRYIHLHDNDGKKDRHWALGDGNIGFDAIFNALRDIRFDGDICIETWPLRWDKSIEYLASRSLMRRE